MIYNKGKSSPHTNLQRRKFLHRNFSSREIKNSLFMIVLQANLSSLRILPNSKLNGKITFECFSEPKLI